MPRRSWTCPPTSPKAADEALHPDQSPGRRPPPPSQTDSRRGDRRHYPLDPTPTGSPATASDLEVRIEHPSTGDKSTLALALFLAKLNADPALDETIVVLDDPFTSLDNFRRQFTAIEIKRLCGQAAQTVVLSHDKNFLRLLWETIDQSTVKCVAIQAGAPGMTTIAPYDIESETRPRHITERMKIAEFVEGELHEAGYIRTRLRTVCEDFYRRGEPTLFHEAASLEQITRLLEDAPEEHPYKGVIENLRDINEYSRGEHHAEVEDDPSGESSDEELKGFCRRVLHLTHGM